MMLHACLLGYFLCHECWLQGLYIIYNQVEPVSEYIFVQRRFADDKYSMFIPSLKPMECCAITSEACLQFCQLNGIKIVNRNKPVSRVLESWKKGQRTMFWWRNSSLGPRNRTKMAVICWKLDWSCTCKNDSVVFPLLHTCNYMYSVLYL